MATRSLFSVVLFAPFRWVASRWRHEWMWVVHRALFKVRHYRRLLRLTALLAVFTAVWCSLVVGLGLLFGGARLLWQAAFIQNILASFLVMPISLAIGVVVGTLLEKHSLRFKVRHASDKLAAGVRLTTFKFILFLLRECRLPIDIQGPVNHRFVQRARSVAQRELVASGWTLALPAGLEPTLNTTVDELVRCFRNQPELQIAFPQSFERVDRLESLMASIKAGTTQSSPDNTTLIVLHYAAEMLDELE